MKRSSSPENDDGPVQKRFTDEKRVLNEWNQFYKRADTSGKVVWSGTLKIPDSRKIAFDCSIKAPPQNEGIKSLFPLKQLTIRIFPTSNRISLRPYMQQSRKLILCRDENTDMMSHSAFSQAIRRDSNMSGCAVLKNTASALHLLFVASLSYEHEDYILGVIETYHANDTVLGILRSHGLLPCAHPEHSKERPMADMIKQLENWEHGRELLAQEHATMKRDVQSKESMLQARKTELTKMKMELEEMNKQIVEKDKVLKKGRHKYKVLEKEKTELEEELQCKVKMLDEEQKLHKEKKKMVEKKEKDIVHLQGEMDEKRKLVEEQKTKLAEMEKKIEEMNTQIMEKGNALTKNSNALMRKSKELQIKNKTLKQQQYMYKVLKKEKTKLEEELQCKVQMLEEEKKLHQEKKKMVEKKEEDIVNLQGEMDEKIKLVETELTEMEKKIEEKNTQIMEKDNALSVKDTKIMTLQQNQHKVEEMLEGTLRMVRNSDAGREGLHNINQSNNIEADTEQILMMESSRLELQNEVAMKQAALDEIGNMMENEFKCSICSELFIKTVTLNCSHSFCDFCFQKWKETQKKEQIKKHQKMKSTCPHCRAEVTASVRSVVLDSLIEKIIDKSGDEAKQRRNETVKERERDIQQEGQLCSIPTYVRHSDDETSTASSPASSLAHLSPSAPFMSPYNPPGTSYSMYPPYSYSPSQN